MSNAITDRFKLMVVPFIVIGLPTILFAGVLTYGDDRWGEVFNEAAARFEPVKHEATVGPPNALWVWVAAAVVILGVLVMASRTQRDVKATA